MQRRDEWGRALAICTTGGVDIGAELVRRGLAVTYRDEPRYSPEEAEARAARRGLWAGEFVDPYRGRRGERLP